MRNIVVVVTLIVFLVVFTYFSQKGCISSPDILADCFINFNISTWKDINRDGIWDPSEPPLEGIEFHIDGRFASMLTKYPCISDEDGLCIISTWAPGNCEPGDYEVTAIPPDAYQPTTPTTITVVMHTTDYSAELQFGFTNNLN